MTNKYKIASIIGLVTILTVLVGTSLVKAQTSDNEYPPFVQNLAKRFGLNEDEVKTFFDEEHLERFQQMQKNREERLSEAVANGVITEEQRQAIIAKQNEFQEERGTQRQQHREEMETWMESQGIDFEALREYMGGPGQGRGGKGGMWK